MANGDTRGRYPASRVAMHWLAFALVGFILTTGFLAAASVNPSAKVALLQLHASAGACTAVVTVLWLFARIAGAAVSPLEGAGRASRAAASFMHYTLLITILATAALGATTLYVSGAFDIVFGGSTAPFPDFFRFPVRRLHGLGGRLVILFVLVHLLAAIYHQLIRRRPIFRRISF